jgi:hypothetical protein
MHVTNASMVPANKPDDMYWLVMLQVTLFKRNYAHVVSESYFKSYHTVARGNPNYFITYGNGKSAARVRPGLRPNGAHRWYNYFRAPM